ncbi:MAG: beta-glucanase [Marinilabiliaceae bacterium]|nr:beta-glucanase [Marinilabiliaceae bacterium]
MKKLVGIIVAVIAFVFFGELLANGEGDFFPGEKWFDTDSIHINAHGGGVCYYDGIYFWFGEHKTSGRGGNSAQVGVRCYSSVNLYDWKNEGVVLNVSSAEGSEIEKGCVIERPKVVYNKATGRFVMWFHLERKGRGYNDAYTAVAVSDKITGPYSFVKSVRPNAGTWPLDYSGVRDTLISTKKLEWWTPEFNDAVNDGLFVRRDFSKGQMSRDMTLFVDDDGTAYHIHSSEENLTLHISKLTGDYISFTNEWIRVFPGGHNEAPAVFKYKNRYFMITSGCTGWDPNEARLAVADSMMGHWTYLGNPCVGEDANKTFYSQSTYVLPVAGKNDAFIFMADRWNPSNPIDGRYVWLPLMFNNDVPYLKWFESWNFNVFHD